MAMYWGAGQTGKWGEVLPRARPHLVQDVLVEVGHVSLAGHRAVIVIPEVLLQSHRVVGDVQDRVQVVGQHLRQSGSLPSRAPAETGLEGCSHLLACRHSHPA